MVLNSARRVLDTFVVSQLRAGSSATRTRARLFHLRQQKGRHEVDIVSEAGRRVVGMEVKANSHPTLDSAKHLVWLRDRLGRAFVHGVVFHTGPRAYQLDEGISAVPVAALWA